MNSVVRIIDRARNDLKMLKSLKTEISVVNSSCTFEMYSGLVTGCSLVH